MQDRFSQVSREDALKMTHCRQACHAMLYAPCPGLLLFDCKPVRYAVMMQMRFDGTLGFVGGFVDKGETLTVGLKREMAEELGCTADDIQIDDSNYVVTHVDTESNICLHFYAKELDYKQYVKIEKNAVNAADYGSEVLGVIRCPVYVYRKSLGLPQFLLNNFVGMARDQLTHCLVSEHILTKEELEHTLKLSDELKKNKV
eukprot:m.48570 g.48570  ORF g.48570 m.48570 type:complete len:201 (+) comp33889_c0_seq1:156-758(+)